MFARPFPLLSTTGSLIPWLKTGDNLSRHMNKSTNNSENFSVEIETFWQNVLYLKKLIKCSAMAVSFWWKLSIFFSLIIISLHFSNVYDSTMCYWKLYISFCKEGKIIFWYSSSLWFSNKQGLLSRFFFKPRNYDSVLWCLRHKWQWNGDGICTYNRCLVYLLSTYLLIHMKMRNKQMHWYRLQLILTIWV